MLRSIRNHNLTKKIFSSFEDQLHSLLDWLDGFFIVRLVARTVVEMSQDDATHMAAGVAYYALFSLFPLMLGLVAVLSFIGLESIQASLTRFVESYLPGSESFVTGTVRGIPGALGLAAVIGLFWSGSAIFGAITRAVNRAWDVHKDRPIYLGKPRQLAMALGVGILFLLSIGATTIVEVIEDIGVSEMPLLNPFGDSLSTVMVRGVSYFFTLCIFLFIYKYLPNTKTYWKYVWSGAFLAAILFELSKSLFIIYLQNFASFTTLYGSLSPVIVFLFWTYIVALILILGAELSSEYGRMMMGVSRGQLLHPGDDSPSRFIRIRESRANDTSYDAPNDSNGFGRAGYIARPHQHALMHDLDNEAADNPA